MPEGLQPGEEESRIQNVDLAHEMAKMGDAGRSEAAYERQVAQLIEAARLEYVQAKPEEKDAIAIKLGREIVDLRDRTEGHHKPYDKKFEPDDAFAKQVGEEELFDHQPNPFNQDQEAHAREEWQKEAYEKDQEILAANSEVVDKLLGLNEREYAVVLKRVKELREG